MSEIQERTIDEMLINGFDGQHAEKYKEEYSLKMCGVCGNYYTDEMLKFVEEGLPDKICCQCHFWFHYPIETLNEDGSLYCTRLQMDEKSIAENNYGFVDHINKCFMHHEPKKCKWGDGAEDEADNCIVCDYVNNKIIDHVCNTEKLMPRTGVVSQKKQKRKMIDNEDKLFE